MTDIKCNHCLKSLPPHLRNICCFVCNKFYHIKCTDLKSKNHFVTLANSGAPWICHKCAPAPRPPKIKCNSCKRTMAKGNINIKCYSCKKFFHSNCSGITTEAFSHSPNWYCNCCSLSFLPFSNIDDTRLGLTLQGKSVPDRENLEIHPNFSIKTLLDKIPGKITIETDEFLSESINSKYYTANEFISSKIRKDIFSIFHLNIASLDCHIDDLKALLALLDHPFNIIGITETKIRESSEPATNISLDNYFFENTPTLTHFGGAALYIRKGQDYILRPDLSKSVLSVAENIFIEITLENAKKMLVGCFYRHHTSIKLFVDDFLLDILNKVRLEKNKICSIMGDFNIDLLKIDEHDDTNYFYNILSTYGFRPLILQPTRITSSSATLIDNIFINDMSVESVGGNISTSISDHFPQFCSFDVKAKKQHNKGPKFGRSYKNFNDDEFQNELKVINWDRLFKDKNIDEQVSIFLGKINGLLDEMAPVRRLTKKEINLKQNPWITRGILKSMRSRDKLYKDFVKERDITKKNNLHTAYKILRNQIITLIRRSRNSYYASYFEEHKTNAKKTWEGIRKVINVSKKNKTMPAKLVKNNADIEGEKNMAGAYNEFFVNIGNMVEQKIPISDKHFSSYLGNSASNSIFLKSVDNKEVLDMLNHLNSSKSCGPNSIPSNLLKTHALHFVEPIKFVINKSLVEGKFPDLLKIAEVCPIYKKGDKSKCENYRPISLLSNLSKLFERAMHTRLYEFLENSNALYNLQFGFRKNFSTNHALLSIVEEIRKNLDDRTFSCGVFVDLEKAFDTVNHAILIKKLDFYGVRGPANSWFLSYLSNRNQMVRLNEAISPPLKITCGVPQGSILGPLLFLIYINDMNKSVKYCRVHHFADDTNLLYSHKNPKLLRKHMNEDLKSLFNWLCANRLSLNVSKTEFIIFRPPRTNVGQRITLSLNRNTIFESTKIKYLGVIMDSKLSWKHHIFELRKKLNRAVGMIYKLKNVGCDQQILRSLYYSLFQSHLTYGLCVWGTAHYGYIHNLFLTQKRAIRAIAGLDFNESTKVAFCNLQILKVHDLFKFQYASLMWDQDHNLLPDCLNKIFVRVADTHSYETRSSAANKLSINAKINTKTHGETLLQYQGPKILNDLKDLKFYGASKTKKSFQAKYKKYIFSMY